MTADESRRVDDYLAQKSLPELERQLIALRTN
jgi:hypothetical protein